MLSSSLKTYRPQRRSWFLDTCVLFPGANSKFCSCVRMFAFLRCCVRVQGFIHVKIHAFCVCMCKHASIYLRYTWMCLYTCTHPHRCERTHICVCGITLIYTHVRVGLSDTELLSIRAHSHQHIHTHSRRWKSHACRVYQAHVLYTETHVRYTTHVWALVSDVYRAREGGKEAWSHLFNLTATHTLRALETWKQETIMRQSHHNFNRLNCQLNTSHHAHVHTLQAVNDNINIKSTSHHAHVHTLQALNDHINVEYTASYAYHALFSYFDRDTVGLAGHAKFFAGQSVEERGHAEEFMRYQNIRGIHSWCTCKTIL